MTSVKGVAPNLDRMQRALVGIPTLKADEAINDSDKSFTVAANEHWWILSIWAELISTATVGDRRVEVQMAKLMCG